MSEQPEPTTVGLFDTAAQSWREVAERATALAEHYASHDPSPAPLDPFYRASARAHADSGALDTRLYGV